MYVDSTDDDTTTDSTDDTYGDDSTDTTDSSGHDEMEVEIDGESYEVVENYDMDEDGANGYVGFEDSDGDGTADVAVEYDEDGNPVAAAEYDEASGEWEDTDVEDLPAPVGGDGTDDGPGASDSSDDTDTTDTTDTTGSSSGEDITVDMPGEDVDAGPATYDTDNDGVNDTAVVTDTEGNTYAFTDTDGDGEADEAVVIESDGDVTVLEHTGEDEWTETESGTIDENGNYESDSGSSSSSDAVWAER
jgi:hypothetical protein